MLHASRLAGFSIDFYERENQCFHFLEVRNGLIECAAARIVLKIAKDDDDFAPSLILRQCLNYRVQAIIESCATNGMGFIYLFQAGLKLRKIVRYAGQTKGTRPFLIRPLRYLNGRTPSPVSAEAIEKCHTLLGAKARLVSANQ
jgi:hypothetical protein